MSSQIETPNSLHGEPGERKSVAQNQQPPGVSRSDRQALTPVANVMRGAGTVDTRDTTSVREELSTRRLNLMRFGYAFVAMGLAIAKWPVLIQDARSLPVMEGVVISLLTAMSLLAFLGLRYPVRLLPILLFEMAWKVIWIAAVAVPRLVSGDMSAATGEVLFNCSFVVIILAVIPWGHAWRRYVRTPGDAWR